MDQPSLDFYPLTQDSWEDFEALFGVHGAVGGCWCMWWRLKRSEFNALKGEKNKEAMKNIVSSGDVPGILAYMDGKAVGWCSIAVRETFPVLDRSRVLKRIDDQPVWSIVCFFIDKGYRHKGISARLLKAALDYAKEQGAEIVEGYPVDPKRGSTADLFAFTGLRSMFVKAGFVEVERRSETRPIMRYYFNQHDR